MDVDLVSLHLLKLAPLEVGRLVIPSSLAFFDGFGVLRTNVVVRDKEMLTFRSIFLCCLFRSRDKFRRRLPEAERRALRSFVPNLMLLNNKLIKDANIIILNVGLIEDLRVRMTWKQENEELSCGLTVLRGFNVRNP